MPRFNSFAEYWRKNFTKNPLPQIPGNLRIPFVGDTFQFLKDPIALFAQKQKQYGDIFKVRLFGENVVFMLGAEANRFLLIEQAKHLSNEEGWQFSIGELFRNGLMLKDGEEHKYHRSILQSAFKKEPMAGYLADIIPTTQQYLQTWQNETELMIFPAMKALTLQIAGKVFFGLDFNDDLQKINQAIIQVVRASSTGLPFAIPFTTYWRGLQARQVLEDYFGGLIADRRQNPTQDIFGMLCIAQNDEGASLSDQEIIDHLIFLLMAGHDTTASTLTSLFYELAVNPNWQEALREISQQFAAGDQISFQNLHNQLVELDWAIKETLRLHPPLIMIPRKSTQEIQFGNLSIPPQTAVTALIYHNHFEGQYFKNPETFDPCRFAEPRSEHKKCPHAYAPFGAGQHHCLGYAFAEMQIKVVMHYVLLNYRWSVPPGYQAEYQAIPLQEPKDGLPVKLEKITQTVEAQEV
ncbi:MAG: cytochrome P450 [Microscillaceae bacterium]|jgi:cytochrome P450|nr:cytochrome P450 [Microscillaceae bacterium]